MTQLDWAWVAGLLEGEGCFSFNSGGYPRITLQMTDEDIVSRFANYFDVAYHHRPKRNSKCKDTYQLAIIKTEKLIECYIELYNQLGARRRAKLDEFYEYWISKKHQGIPNMSISYISNSTHNV